MPVTDFVALSKERAFKYAALKTEYCVLLQRLLIVTLLPLVQKTLKSTKSTVKTGF